MATVRIPVTGNTNAQTLGLAALRAADKFGLGQSKDSPSPGKQVTASKIDAGDQDEAFAKAFGIKGVPKKVASK